MSLDNVAEEVEKREENALQRELIDEMMKVLNDREKFVLGQNYGLNGAAEKTLVEIGKELGMSSERVRQIKLNAMRKIRTFSLIMEEDCEDFNLSDIY